MAFSNQIIDFILHLNNNNFFKKIKSVIDMGDQDINLNFDEIKKKFSHLNEKELNNFFSSSKNYPKRPRSSSSSLWKSIGIEKTDRIDMVELEREGDVNHIFYKADLNYPLEKQIKLEQYDLVTDIGNNEHPFNIAETYKSMHKLTKKNGFMLIQQSVFKGNGLFNFNLGFFEMLAATNNYKIVFASYCITYKDKYFFVPLAETLLDVINLNKVKEIEIIYLLNKKEDYDFCYPYQDLGKNYKHEEYYEPINNFQSSFPERNYVPVNANFLSIRKLIKIIINKIKFNIKK